MNTPTDVQKARSILAQGRETVTIQLSVKAVRFLLEMVWLEDIDVEAVCLDQRDELREIRVALKDRVS